MAQLALYEIAVDVGSHGVSAAFGSFRFAKKPFPGQQIRAGDEYMERALSLSEQYYDLFDDEERRQVADVYSHANRVKAQYRIVTGPWDILSTSHSYRKSAKRTYDVAEELSRLKRAGKAFAKRTSGNQVTTHRTTRNAGDTITLELILKRERRVEVSSTREDPENPFHSNADDAEIVAVATSNAPELTSALSGWQSD
ncbi:hypothetical protein EVG20_g9453 [Dentipellis fragilis]|uniref:Uncharacterized protein n=1 Tax=Dentipellis fragilis TaxID=205917 RepID=A0A4Y9Y2F5_9AGAM|nr:hypothetical protein EVG20_g9453 [Dentipellis fragilis]